MSFTLEDCIVSFRFLRDSQKFSASVQSCYFVILTEFQAAGFPEQIWLSTRSLMDMAGLKSVSATQEAKNVLKNHKLIDFKTTKKGTVYRLGEPILQYTPRNTCGTPVEQSRNTQWNTYGFVSCAQNAGAITNTRDDGAENAAPLSPSPAPLSSIPQTTEALNPNQSLASSKAGKAEDEKAIEDIWEQMTGKRLERAAECDELRALEKTHGREIIKVAIAEHVRCNGRSFNYFKACMQTALKKKGGDKNVRVAQRPVNNRPNVLNFTAQRTAGDFGDTQTRGKGRFDDEEPDYSWLYGSSASVAAGDRGD